MAAIRRFEDIEGWQASRHLSQELFRITQNSRQFKDSNLLTQLSKCTDSAMANIVEGFDSGSDPEFLRFLKISYRSLSEFQSHLYTALDRNYLPQLHFDLLYGLAREAKGKVGGFMRYLRKPRKRSRADSGLRTDTGPGTPDRPRTRDAGHRTSGV